MENKKRDMVRNKKIDFCHTQGLKKNIVHLISTFLLTFLTAFFFISSSYALPKRDHLVYFPNTAYELNVYKIYGKMPGKTLMLIGGIQGNEPGGFLSADLYADMKLEKGNLVVVPRANFYSIMLNSRGPNGDMNRKFSKEDSAESMEDKIVTILKKLIEGSDYLLNLHDGSGYYYPTYVDKWRNPLCFGQSIIADADKYTVPGTGAVLDLGEMARKVLDEVNPEIKNELYQFHFNNTKTSDPDSPHKEQKKSASYYALTHHHIPAFGIESSKFLPTIDLKVLFHNMVINAFMKHFEIIPAYPGFAFDPPSLKYIIASINGADPVAIAGSQSITLSAGDSINISHIESNYERGLSLDILGHGDLNDFRNDIIIVKDTVLIVRKDNLKFAEIPIVISGVREPSSAVSVPAPKYEINNLVIEVKGLKVLLDNGQALSIVRGDHLKILDVQPSGSGRPGLTVNFKGFVGPANLNTGEDRGYDIDTESELMRRFSLNKDGRRYEIVAMDGEKVLGKFYIDLEEPKLEYLMVKLNRKNLTLLPSEDSLSMSGHDELHVNKIISNLYDSSDLYAEINGKKIIPGKGQNVMALIDSFGGREYTLHVRNRNEILGSFNILLN